jgi:hypothetical protein
MTKDQFFTALKNRTAGWEDYLLENGPNLSPHERWWVEQVLTNPPSREGSVESKSGTALGALSVLTAVSEVSTVGGAGTASLADGAEGQFKSVYFVADGGDLVLTPANLRAGTTITFNDANDFVVLQFLHGEWSVIVNSGATVA